MAFDAKPTIIIGGLRLELIAHGFNMKALKQMLHELADSLPDENTPFEDSGYSKDRNAEVDYRIIAFDPNNPIQVVDVHENPQPKPRKKKDDKNEPLPDDMD